MAGTKFQYDESGTTFYYFLLSFASLVIIPLSYFFWPRPPSSTDPTHDHQQQESFRRKKRCFCDPCVAKHNYIQSRENTTRPKVIKCVIILSWIMLAVFAYKVALIKPDYVNYDPFEILGISPGASKAEIKKAYHVLSLVHHPDKETGDAKRFMLISKAYAALTDETARKNWEEYGNPDGPGAMSFGIALPSWIVEKENSVIVLLVYVLLLMIALPVGVGIWWSNSSKYGGGFKVLMDTSQLYYYYIYKTPSMILRRVLIVIAASFEFHREHNSEVIERPSDNHEIPQLIKEIPNAFPNNKEAPLFYPYSIKARALIYAHLLRLPLPPDTLAIDRNYILAKLPYLIQEFVQCVAQLTLLAKLRKTQRTPSLETIENAMKLNALVVQGMWINKNAMLQLPHVTEDMLRHFINRKRNIRTLQQLAALANIERREMLRGLTDEQYADVENFIGQLPLLDVEARCEVLGDEDGGKITAGALVTVTVILTRKEMSTLFTVNDQNSSENSKTLHSIGDLDPDVDGGGGGEQQQDGAGEQDSNRKQPPQRKVWEKSNKGGKGKKAKRKAAPKSRPGAARNVASQQQQQQQLSKKMATNNESDASEADAPAMVMKNKKSGKQDHNGGDSVAQNGSVGNSSAQQNRNKDDNNEDYDSSGGDGDDSDERQNPQQQHNDEDDDDDDWEKEEAPSVPKKEIFQTISKISHPVHCPYFPDDKQEHWWIYVTDRKQPYSLITVPYFMTNLVDREEVELKFTAPWKPGPYTYQIAVRSDSYVDVDYFKLLKINVQEAPKEIKTHPQWEISDDDEDQEDDDDSAVSDSDLVDSDEDEHEQQAARRGAKKRQDGEDAERSTDNESDDDDDDDAADDSEHRN